MMIARVVADMLAAGLKVRVAADPRLRSWFCGLGGRAGKPEVVCPRREESLAAFLRRIMQGAELFLPIAPETSNRLAEIVEIAAEQAVECLASDSATIRLVADKKALGERAARFGVSSVIHAEQNGFYALKPNLGAGCEGVYRLSRKPSAVAKGRLITPWLDGEQLSLSAIFNRGEGRLLQVNRQGLRIGHKGKVELKWLESGIKANKKPFERLVKALGRAFPGLWGFCGADVVRSRGRLWLVELNPRLTVAYLGFERSRENPISRLLALRAAEPMTEYLSPPKIKIAL